MICESTVKNYCRDSLDKIENYEKAINDKENVWDCHHKLELTINDEPAHTIKELIRLGMYYNRPYFELIFLKKDEHRRLHRKGKKLSESAKMKVSEFQKSRVHQKVSEETKKRMRESRIGKPISIFGKKFVEHYGASAYKDMKLYKREHHLYRKLGRCSWEA